MTDREKLIELICKAHNAVTAEDIENDVSYCSKIKRQVESQLERLVRMKNEELIPALKIGDASKRNPGASDRMANAVIRRLAYEDEIAASMEENLAEMDAVRAAIASLPDPMEQEVLNMRYIDCEGYRHTPWRDVVIRLYTRKVLRVGSLTPRTFYPTHPQECASSYRGQSARSLAV